jgi:hypothetical protein
VINEGGNVGVTCFIMCDKAKSGPEIGDDLRLPIGHTISGQLSQATALHLIHRCAQ